MAILYYSAEVLSRQFTQTKNKLVLSYSHNTQLLVVGDPVAKHDLLYIITKKSSCLFHVSPRDRDCFLN